MKQPDYERENIKLYNADYEDLGVVDCDVMITDPPYEIEMMGGGIGDRRKYTHDTNGFTDTGFDYNMLDNYTNWMVFCSKAQICDLIDKASARRWMLITWNKPNPTPLCGGNYLPDTEYIVHSFPSSGLKGGYHERSRWVICPAVKHDYHPNQKPVEVMNKCIGSSSEVGDMVFDPFMGSGSTGVACVGLNRKFIGVERKDVHFNSAVSRIEKAFTGVSTEEQIGGQEPLF